MRYLRPDLANTYRRFVDGSAFRLSDMNFRVRPGKKKPGDLVLEWQTPTGWAVIKFDALGLIVDFLYENEHHLYPPSQGFQGGEKVREFVKESCQYGYDKAVAKLNVEKLTSRLPFPESEAS